MEKIVYLEKRELDHYPENNEVFHPSVSYPEYAFGSNCISSTSNEVYDMVRESLHGLGLDEAHYGKPDWNPLGDIIRPGETVVVKPNMVKHCNTKEKYACTLTHPSVVRTVIDYCIIAKAGRIILGDAPIQGADMDKIRREYYYDKLLGFYHNQKINIDFVDFRDLVVKVERGIIKTLRKGDNTEFITIELGKESKHYQDNANVRYETCGYVDKTINENHHGNRHAYVLSKYILEADVIINLPKPKTHRFAGITGAQKNFVGACSDKESLPHFKAGAKCVGGDETNKNTMQSKIIAYCYRKYLWACKNKQEKRGKVWYFFYAGFSKLRSSSLFIHGAWYGNDTIWRTIIDLNKIILYAKKDGSLDFSKIQRRVLSIGDMVIAGEKEGPLNPSSKPLGIILSSKNCAVFDAVFCKITGFDSQLIPTVRHSIKNTKLCPIPEGSIRLFSNQEIWNDVLVEDLDFPEQFHFQAHPFWKDIL